MSNWDDIRYFLAVARGGSVRAAADILKVNHSTALRRVAQLEDTLGAQIFEKLPSGYKLTAAGEEILELAEQMEASSNRLATRVFGRDQSLSGSLRFALPTSLATNLLMPDFVEFCERHPEIELELLTSYEPVNLAKRQADIALRVVYDRASLPPALHGHQLHDLFGGVYLSRTLSETLASNDAIPVKWLLKTSDGPPPGWAKPDVLSVSEIAFRVSDAETQLTAVRASMGLARLPCFIGDADPNLVRAPGSITKRLGTLWLLTYGETRKTRRVRLFSEFIQRRIAAYAPLLAGLGNDLSS